MSDNRLKQAVIGVGGLGSKHVFRFQVLENAEVVAVCDVNAKRAEKVARANRTRHWFTDPEAMFREVEIDSVSIGASDPYHAPLRRRRTGVRGEAGLGQFAGFGKR